LLTELREVCAELRPPMLDTLGLGAALRALAEEWSAQQEIAVDLDACPSEALHDLPDEVAVNLFRVVQEGLSNVARHAEARRVAIQLARDKAQLVLTLNDDGRGFAAPASLRELVKQDHYGLVGIQERVNLIGGTLTVESAPGQGTTVRVVWEGAGDEQDDA
jgi:signal transduction histidine kinase